VHRPLVEEGEDRGSHVAAAGPRPAPAAEAAPAAELGAAAVVELAADPRVSVLVSMVHLEEPFYR